MAGDLYFQIFEVRNHRINKKRHGQSAKKSIINGQNQKAYYFWFETTKQTNNQMKTTHTFLALCVGYIILFSSPKSFSQYPTPPERPYKAYSRNGDNTGWTVMPVRSKEEFDLHLAGGGSHQIMHGMVRCNQHPEIVYALQDISGPWRSIDGGKSWTKPRAMGLIAVYGQSIAVDPVNPARILVSTYHPWDGGLPAGKGMNDHAGIYLSEDYGETFSLVLNKPDFGFNWHLHRGYNENLVFSPASIDN